MREILFRGKRYDDGNWVEGYLIHDEFCNTNIPYIGYLCDVGHDVDIAEIILGTVGQFTGLTDKNGKKIFEGDIIRANLESGNHEGFVWPNMPVDFQQGSFCLNDRKGYVFAVLGAFAPSVAFEVIGNIHDNPELLEEDQ